MQKVGFVLLFFSLGLSYCSAVCLPNTICTNDRDRILQSDNDISPAEKYFNKGRAWYIRPSPVATNALLAFKNFTTSGFSAVVVITYHSRTAKTTQYFYGDLGNFEVLCEDSIGIIVYVPINAPRTPNFKLDYYTGCGILTSLQSQVKYTSGNFRSKDNYNCWFIQQPMINSVERKRVYFTIRDLILAKGEEFMIWDVHTLQVMGFYESSKTYDTFAIESNATMSIIIEITKQSDSTMTQGSQFMLTFYTMTGDDIDCIERKRKCEETTSDTPSFIRCKEQCGTFDNMLLEEYSMDSDIPTAGPRFGGFFNQCPYVRSACKCDRDTVDHRDFCLQETKCFEQGGCSYACIFAKMSFCSRMTVISVLQLL